MSNVMTSSRVRRQTQDAEPWSVLDPPPLTVRQVLGDLRERWKDEFAGEGISTRLAFSALRILQHVSYRLGYGCGRVRASLPSPRGPDLVTMERNLLGLPKALRLVWLQTFLGNLNTQAAAPRNPLPRSVVFELAGTCNFRCIGCEAGRGGIDASRFMPAASLRRWAEETARDAQHIRINGMGEATLHPALKECLDILAGFPGGREIITNLSAPIGVYEDLLDRGYVILVSWDGCTRDTFEGIRRGADFGSMVEKLPLLTRVADRTGAPDPPLLFTIRPENILELSGTVSLAARAGVRRIIVNTFKDGTGSDWVSSRSADIREAFAGASVRALAEGVSLALPDHIGKEPFLSDDAYACSAGGCTFPSTQAVVRWNGDVTPCNMLNPYLYGNIEERGFEGCWNGPEARTFRTMTENHPYCEDCYYVDVTRRRRYADTPLARLQNHTPV